MLQFIRDRAQGVIAWFIVFLIIVPFAMWGINDYMGGGKEKPVAEVNGAAISKGELQEAFLQQRQRLEQMLGPSFKPEMFAEAPMKQAILDSLIEQELVVQAVHDAGLRVSNAAVAELIRNVQPFQENGKFSQAAYERALRRQGTTPASFEADVRREIVADQWRRALQQSAFVTRSEAERFVRLQGQTRDLSYVLLPASKFEAAAQVSDADIQGFYDENKAAFTEPEKVRVAYLELSSAKLASGAQVADEEVRAYYEAHKDEFSEPESRRASHILFRVESGANAEAEQAARAKAEDTLKRIRAGESFEKLAKELSQDPGSAQKGGDLGFFGRGAMVPPFEEKVFTLAKGEISEPVRTDFGYHIIRLDEVRGGAAKPFAQVFEQIDAKLRAEKAQERFYDLSEKLNNLTYEHPETLQVAADELKLPVQQTGYFSRKGGEGLASNPAFVQAAFNEEVLERGNNSDVLELSAGEMVVLRVEDRRPETLKPLNEVRAEIVARLRKEKAAAAVREAAAVVLAAVRKGEDAAALAKAHGGTLVSKKGVGRAEGTVPRPVVEAAFRMPRPAKEPVAEQVTLPNADEAVVVLHSVQDGPATGGEEAVAQAALVQRGDAESSYQGALVSLRQQADIDINKDQM